MTEPLSVYLWRLSTGSDTGRLLIERCSDRLPRNELDRCYRLQQKTDRDMAILSRVMVRTMLSFFHELAPTALTITRTGNGKPVITSSKPCHHFSLSHSRGQVLLAVSTKPIGVDLEYHNKERDIRTLCQRYFSEAEARHLKQLPEKQAVPCFYDLWVLKEACCKAIDLPLASGLDQFYFKPTTVNGFQLEQGNNFNANDWQFSPLKMNTDWSAAVACGCHSGLLTVTDHPVQLPDALSLWD